MITAELSRWPWDSRGERKVLHLFFSFNLTKTNKFFLKQTFDLCRRCESCRRCRRYGKDRCSVQMLKQCRRSYWRGTGVTFTKHHPIRRRCESSRRRYGKECFAVQILKQCRRRCLGVRRTEARVQGVHSTGVSGMKSPTRVLRHAEQLQTTKLSDLVTTALLRRSPL